MSQLLLLDMVLCKHYCYKSGKLFFRQRTKLKLNNFMEYWDGTTLATLRKIIKDSTLYDQNSKFFRKSYQFNFSKSIKAYSFYCVLGLI